MSAPTETATAPAAPSVPLYDLTAALAQVNAWAHEEAAEHEGELPDWLEALQLEAEEAIEAKVERIGRFIRWQAGLASAAKAEAATLQARVKRFEGRVARVKEYVRVLLGANGLKKIETATVTVSRAGNGGKRPLTLLVPAEELMRWPDAARFVRAVTTLEVDTDALRAHLEATGADALSVELEGGRLQPLVRLEPRGEHARVA